MSVVPLPVPGSIVMIRQRRWRVERARRSRNVVRLDVVGRDRAMTFLAPFDRAAVVLRSEAPRSVRPQQALARLAHVVGASAGHHEIGAALHADVRLLPYQLEPTLALLAGRRRLLVADEVGLGKTIQAGLAIAEVVRRDPGARVLVLVPASIRDQWTDELARRFQIEVLPASHSHLQAMARSGGFGDNPWNRSGVWLASLDFVKQPHVMASLPPSPWDIVVVDEAHDAAGDSERHAACRALARRARRVMLLSATPHSGDVTRFERLLDLGALPCDDGPATVFRRTRRSLGIEARRRVRWRLVRPSSAEARLLDALLDFERRVLATAASRQEDAALLLLAVFRKRALSTMLALRRSLDRRLAWLARNSRSVAPDWLQPALDFGGEQDDDLTPGEFRSLTADIGLAAGHERSWLRRLRALAIDAERHETRVRRLAALLGRAGEPAVVFTEFRDSLDALSRGLQGVTPAATLHGGQTAIERRQELARFLTGEAHVLLATDVAGQGLNLQTRARWVINLELPWNPARLEQRAGRVDRIGQPRAARVSLIVSRHPAENGLIARLARRVLQARDTLGADTLEAALPGEDEVRRALLTPGPAREAGATASPRVQASTRWRRPAEAAARKLTWRRAMVDRWRAGDAVPARAVSCDSRRLLGLRRIGGSCLLVFTVPLIDGSGAVIEQHAVVVRAGAMPAGAGMRRAALELARAAAVDRVRPRAARVDRRIRADAERAARVDRVIIRRLVEESAAGEVQTGLFDRRAARVALEAGADAARLEAGLRERLDASRRAGVTIGRPVLQVAIGWRT
jgi:superfamily II DNA or RNA helicase